MCFKPERENFVADTVETPFHELVIRKMTLTNLFALLIKNEPVTIRFAGEVNALVFHPVLSEFIANPAAAIRAINRVNDGAAPTSVFARLANGFPYAGASTETRANSVTEPRTDFQN